MLLRMHVGRQYGALQHADGVVCGVLTYNRIRRGQSHSSRGAVKCNVMGVFRVMYFVMSCWHVIANAFWVSIIMAHCNTLMQWHVMY